MEKQGKTGKHELLNYQCPNCGSSSIRFDIEAQGLLCGHCGYTKQLIPESDEVKEHPLHLEGALMQRSEGLEMEVKVFHCKSCGSETSHPEDQVKLTCAFCGSENVNKTATETRVIKPTGLIPFKITKKLAISAYKNWLGKGLFTPNKLKERARIKNIRGVYLPFWTFDAFTHSKWTAQSGYYYYETESYTDSQGNRQTRQVQKVRWVPSSGTFDHFFDDVSVLASHGLSNSMVSQILPYQVEEANNFDNNYLMGWETELYQKDIKEGYRLADKIMDERLYQLCSGEVPGDTHRFLRVDTHKEGLTFKHMLYPVWVAAYTYKEKVFQFILNGQTGKVSGKKPKAAWKIILAILGGIILGAGIYYLIQTGQ
ncbi:MAG: zinc ribbon domain-containing protein [Bacteroidia bacterium]|nr:zinc ribbon domain-containing protein [Bacteroidia bacterium]